MKKVIKIILVLLFGSSFYNCSIYKNQLFKGEGGIEQARMNVIIDFISTYKTPRNYLKEREGKPFDVFVLDRRKQSNEDLYVFTVLPEYQEITLNPEDDLGKVPKSYFPNKFVVEEDKLFLWHDSVTPLQKELLNVMDEFGALDSIDVKRELGLLPDDYEDTRTVIIDDGLKGVTYFICKDNIENYKKVVTNKAFGYYDPPKLKCGSSD